MCLFPGRMLSTETTLNTAVSADWCAKMSRMHTVTCCVTAGVLDVAEEAVVVAGVRVLVVFSAFSAALPAAKRGRRLLFRFELELKKAEARVRDRAEVRVGV